MPIFKVECFDAGIKDGKGVREVEATNEQEAAELVCGGPLRDGGKLGQLRAQVYPPAAPKAKKLFYTPSSN